MKKIKSKFGAILMAVALFFGVAAVGIATNVGPASAACQQWVRTWSGAIYVNSGAGSSRVSTSIGAPVYLGQSAGGQSIWRQSISVSAPFSTTTVKVVSPNYAVTQLASGVQFYSTTFSGPWGRPVQQLYGEVC